MIYAALTAGVGCLVIISVVSWMRRSAQIESEDRFAADPVRELAAVAAAATSPAEILERVVAALRQRASATRAIVFRLHDEAWQAVAGDAEGEVPALLASPMAWFAHNPGVVTAGDLGAARFGAIGPAIEKLLSHYEINALVPLVDRRLVVAVIGVALPPLSAARRARIDRVCSLAAAACANLRLHAEAAHAISLDRGAGELEGIRTSLVPEPAAGRSALASYASHRRITGAIGSDFALVRAEGGALWIAVGDAVGSGLAAALIAAAVAGAIDAAIDRDPELSAAALLALANLPLDRPGSRARASCVCARLTPGAIEWASAGHVHPYLIQRGELRALVAAAGPLLGERGSIAGSKAAIEPGDQLVFLTNGVIDAVGEGDDQRGHRRIQRLLSAAAGASAVELCAEIAEATFTRRPDPSDDETAVVVTVA